MPVPSECSERYGTSGVCRSVPGSHGQVGVRSHELIDCLVHRERFGFSRLIRLRLSKGRDCGLGEGVVFLGALGEARSCFLTRVRHLFLLLLPFVTFELRVKRFDVSCKRFFILVTRKGGKENLDRPVCVLWVEELVRPAACFAASASFVSIERKADFSVLVVLGSRDVAVRHYSVPLVQAELSFCLFLQVESVEGYPA